MKTRREFFAACGGLALGGVAAKLGIEAPWRVQIDAEGPVDTFRWNKLTTTVPVSDDMMGEGGYYVTDEFREAMIARLRGKENEHFLNDGGTHRVALFDNMKGGKV